MKIAICDDEAAQRSELRGALDRFLAARNIKPCYQEYDSGEPLVRDARRDPFDLIFLDVYLERENGIAVARALRSAGVDAPLVFLTVSREHALESYQVRATDYLLKPVCDKDIARALERALPERSDRLAFRVGSAYRYIPFDEIAYLESRNHAVLLHTVDGECYRGFAKLDDVQDRLRDPRFLRCHRSCLVNMDFIADVRDDFILRDGACVPVRVKERRKMHDAYYRYFVDASCERGQRVR